MAENFAATSKPKFSGLIHNNSRYYLCLCDASALSALRAFLASSHEQEKNIEAFYVGDDVLHQDEWLSVEPCQEKIERKISSMPMAGHLFLAGSAGFISHWQAIALKAGVAKDAISAVLSEDLSRNVQCSHCKSVYEGVQRRIFTCSTCNVELLVRDHFSARLGLFQAVAISPTDPSYAVLVQSGFHD